MYTVHLLDTTNGKRGEHTVLWDWRRFSELKRTYVDDRYRWEIGSHSCDCIRLSYLYPQDRDHTCGYGRVVVQIVYEDRVVYSDHQYEDQQKKCRKGSNHVNTRYRQKV